MVYYLMQVKLNYEDAAAFRNLLKVILDDPALIYPVRRSIGFTKSQLFNLEERVQKACAQTLGDIEQAAKAKALKS